MTMKVSSPPPSPVPRPITYHRWPYEIVPVSLVDPSVKTYRVVPSDGSPGINVTIPDTPDEVLAQRGNSPLARWRRGYLDFLMGQAKPSGYYLATEPAWLAGWIHGYEETYDALMKNAHHGIEWFKWAGLLIEFRQRLSASAALS